MTDTVEKKPAPSRKQTKTPERGRRRGRGRGILAGLVVLAALLVALRAVAPTFLQWYVNRTIDQSPLYDGAIGDVDLRLWRGAYSINEIRIVKTTGNVPVPFFAAKRVDFALEWNALLQRRLVGKMVMLEPELNFVDGENEAEDQTGAGAPWLKIIRDLFPFRINTALIHDGSIHFRAFDTDPPVDVYLSQVEGSIENLTNVYDEITPLAATVSAAALAMDHAKFEYEMKLDPFSYRPTFQLAVRLLGLNVTRINTLARAYGSFDFERGWLDLVVELDAKEGRVEGYIKPLFRNLEVFSLRKDVPGENPLQMFWEALVGVVTGVLKNPPRNQFGTLIPIEGDLRDPESDLLAIIGNVLRNAFIRAYLPKLEGTAPDIDGLRFMPAEIEDPVSMGA